jgi:hypothetical protein
LEGKAQRRRDNGRRRTRTMRERSGYLNQGILSFPN